MTENWSFKHTWLKKEKNILSKLLIIIFSNWTTFLSMEILLIALCPQSIPSYVCVYVRMAHSVSVPGLPQARSAL